jgi:hypothetical protein
VAKVILARLMRVAPAAASSAGGASVERRDGGGGGAERLLQADAMEPLASTRSLQSWWWGRAPSWRLHDGVCVLRGRRCGARCARCTGAALVAAVELSAELEAMAECGSYVRAAGVGTVTRPLVHTAGFISCLPCRA